MSQFERKFRSFGPAIPVTPRTISSVVLIFVITALREAGLSGRVVLDFLLERVIEENKDRYYETLEQSSQHWHEGKHDPWPFIREAQEKGLPPRVAILPGWDMSNEEATTRSKPQSEPELKAGEQRNVTRQPAIGRCIVGLTSYLKRIDTPVKCRPKRIKKSSSCCKARWTY